MKASSPLKIALAQINCKVGDISGNLKKIQSIVHEVSEKKSADLVVFPELALTGYPPEDLLLRTEFYHQTLEAIQALIHAKTEIGVIIGYPIHAHNQAFNAAAFIDKGKIYGIYYKHYLPNYRVFDEKRYFTPGDKPCVVSIKGISVGITICEDIWEPAPVKRAKEAGAELIININASPFHLGKEEERLTTLRQRILENNLPIIYVNMVGGQDELIFDGSSVVLDDTGKLIHQLPFCEEWVEITKCFLNSISRKINFLTPKELSSTKIRPSPPLGKEGVDYPPLSKRGVRGDFIGNEKGEEYYLYQALQLSVRDYGQKNGFKGALIGLSGGIDSALTLAIAADALGPENVTAVMMPSQHTSQISLEDSEKIARLLKVSYKIISIEPLYSEFVKALKESLKGLPTEIVLQNLQARCRGVLLMALSNQTGQLVLTTGNKSELAVGYCTLYGDMAGGFCVLKDLVKTRVWALARYRNSTSPVIPERIITRAPSAELAPNQTDQDALPPYQVLDKILMAYVEQNLSAGEIIAQGFAPDVVHKVINLISKNEYKRFQAPPGPRVTVCAFGKDWRYPLTNGFKSK